MLYVGPIHSKLCNENNIIIYRISLFYTYNFIHNQTGDEEYHLPLHHNVIQTNVGPNHS